MKKYAFIVLAFTFTMAGSALAQTGTPSLGTILSRLVGENNTFTADLLLTVTVSGEATTMPAKTAFNAGKLRVDLNVGGAKAPRMKPENIERMKTMGMDKTVDIARPDKKIAYFLYPNLSAYVETPLQEIDLKPDSAFKVKITELGKETLDSHPCTKNKVIITDDKGNNRELTVWSATDMKKFPLKIEIPTLQDQTTTFAFSNVKMAKPDAGLFELPTGYKQYPSKQDVVREQMKKQMENAAPATNHP
jgi:hypothetical protein